MSKQLILYLLKTLRDKITGVNSLRYDTVGLVEAWASQHRKEFFSYLNVSEQSAPLLYRNQDYHILCRSCFHVFKEPKDEEGRIPSHGECIVCQQCGIVGTSINLFIYFIPETRYTTRKESTSDAKEVKGGS